MLGEGSYHFLGGVRGNHSATKGEFGVQVGGANLQTLANVATMAVNPTGSFTTNAFIERAEEATLHWNAVKQWELAQTFGLEGNQKWYLGPHMEYQADTDEFIDVRTSLGGSESYIGFCMDVAWTPLGDATNGTPYILQNTLDQYTYQQELAWSVYEGKQMGIEPQRLQILSAWVDSLWPQQ